MPRANEAFLCTITWGKKYNLSLGLKPVKKAIGFCVKPFDAIPGEFQNIYLLIET